MLVAIPGKVLEPKLSHYNSCGVAIFETRFEPELCDHRACRHAHPASPAPISSSWSLGQLGAK